jgi:O-antigen ligase
LESKIVGEGVSLKSRDFFISIKPAFFDMSLWMPLLLVTVSFPLLGLGRNTAGEISGGVSFVYAAGVYLVLCSFAVIILRHRSILSQLLNANDLILSVFITVAVIQIAVLGEMSIAINLMVFIGAGYSIRIEQGLFWGSIALCTFIALAYALKGPPIDRWLGGIHPNVFAAACVGLVALSFFGPRWWTDLALIISLAASNGVSSRYAMLVSILIYCFVWMFNLRQIGKFRLGVLFLLPVGLLLELIIRHDQSILSDVFKLHDASRGLSSGVSGRDGHWKYFLPQFFERPLIGYGFRNRSVYSGAHNGFLDIILQMGLIGSTSFFMFWAFRLQSLFKEALMSPSGAMRGRFFSILLALSIGAQLQPQFINFGDPFGIIVMLCLFCRANLETKMERLHQNL